MGMSLLFYYIGLGVCAFVVFLVLIFNFFCGFRCLIEFKLLGGVAVVLGLLSGLFSYLFHRISPQSLINALISAIAAGFTLAFLFGLGAHILLPPMPKECCNPCLISENELEDTFRKLIEKEAQAVKEKRMDLLRLVFSLNAIIVDHYVNGQEQSLEVHYSNKFRTSDFLDLVHDIVTITEMKLSNDFIFTKGAFMLPDRAIAETSSRGTVLEKATDNRIQIDNPPGSDKWTFVRENRCCCWKISKVEFGIHKTK